MSQLTYTVDQAAAFAGLLADSGFHDIVSRISNSRKIASIAITEDNSQTYTVTVAGVEVTYSSDASATTAEIAAGLVQNINAADVDVTAAGADTPITITGSANNPDFTLEVAATGSGALAVTNTQLAGQAIPFGRAVLIDSDDGAADTNIRLPRASGDIANTFGVSVATQAMESHVDSAAANYSTRDCVSVLRKGRVYVQVEEAVTPASDVYIRHGADGAKTRIGGFAASSGTGLAQLSSGARWLSSASAEGFAVLELDLMGS